MYEIPAMKWAELALQLEFWGYRAGSYLLLHVADDPAWLALVFC